MNVFDKKKINWKRAAKNLRRAADRLEKSGWVNGDLEKNGSFCAIGAISYAITGKAITADDYQSEKFPDLDAYGIDCDVDDDPGEAEERAKAKKLHFEMVEAEYLLVKALDRLGEVDGCGADLSGHNLENVIAGWNDNENKYQIGDRYYPGDTQEKIDEQREAGKKRVCAGLRKAADLAMKEYDKKKELVTA